jgi:pre-mRNA-splicing factor ATP-dependent RNA helicase DHX38/PRP16
LLSKKTVAVSDFSKNKTMKEQREFLPVYEVRDELRKIIRENKVVVIVG